MMTTRVGRVEKLGEELRDGLRGLIQSIESPDDPARRCLEIELALSSQEFNGLPLGPALTDLLGAGVLRGTAPTGFRAWWREQLGRAVHTWIPVEPNREETTTRESWKTGRILVALISGRSYHTTWVPRLLEYLGGDRCWVISEDQRLSHALPPGTMVSKWRALPSPEMNRWRTMFRRAFPVWRREVRRLRRTHGFSRTLGEGLLHNLLAASQRVLRFERFLEDVRPAAILVEYDRNTRGACLVLAGRKLGIPTFSLLHGVINGPFGYTPVLADTVLCWGNLQREQLLQAGTPEERIRIVGFERLEERPLPERGTVREKLGISDEALVAVLATNTVPWQEREKLIHVFCRALVQFQGGTGIVRLHPSERLEDYKNVERSFPNILFTANGDLSAEEVFALSDVIVIHSSGFGAEGLAHGTPCAVLDVMESPLGFGIELIRRGGAPRLRGVNDLVQFLVRYQNDGDYRRGLRENAVKLGRELFSARGETACRNIAEVLLECIPGGARQVIGSPAGGSGE